VRKNEDEKKKLPKKRTSLERRQKIFFLFRTYDAASLKFHAMYLYEWCEFFFAVHFSVLGTTVFPPPAALMGSFPRVVVRLLPRVF